MKITYITAGAGGMYCGSCIRDNALAAALTGRGHDVTLLPLYTPPVPTKRTSASTACSSAASACILEQYVSLFRKTPWLLDRLWESSWLLRTVSARAVETRPEQLGALMVSVLEGVHGHQRKELDKLVHWLRAQPRPDVLDISNSMLIAIAGPLKDALGCPIACTLQGENVFMERLLEPYRSRAKELIRSQLSHVDAFVAVSDYYAGYMSRYLGIPGAKMRVVPLGVNVDRYAPATARPAAPFTIGYLGRIAPEKGLHLLCDAYRNLRERGALAGCRIEVAGYLGPEHTTYWQSIEREVKGWELADEIHYRGELDLDHKVAFLQALDLFVVPAVYDDPKGIALLEAMACGVPVVAPRRGTYTEMLERTGGGVLVEPDDLVGLEQTLEQLAGDRARLAELGQRAADGVREHYSTGEMTTRALDVYERLTR